MQPHKQKTHHCLWMGFVYRSQAKTDRPNYERMKYSGNVMYASIPESIILRARNWLLSIPTLLCVHYGQYQASQIQDHSFNWLQICSAHWKISFSERSRPVTVDSLPQSTISMRICLKWLTAHTFCRTGNKAILSNWAHQNQAVSTDPTEVAAIL